MVQLDNMHPITSNAVANKLNGGICSSSKGNTGKIASIDNFVLKAGVIVTVMFTKGNSADNPTLNVSGTGAKPIKVVKAGAKVAPVTHTGYWRGATTTSVEMWQPYTILEFMYDGTDWVIVGNPTVESYSSSSASYEVKADGLIEQRGTIAEKNHRNQNADIKFPISFLNINYYANDLPFFIQDIGNDNPYEGNYSRFGYNKTVNGITIRDFCAWDMANVSWFAIGF